MSDYDLFISYHTQDHVFVTELAKQLKNLKVEVFLDRWHLIPGQPWPQVLREELASCKAVAVCVGSYEMGPWQQREMYFALERQNREKGFPVIPVLLPKAIPPLDFLSQNMWVDFRGGLDNALALATLQAAINRQVLDTMQRERMQEIIRDISPYRGLEYFREQDASFFFGRDQAIKELQDKLAKHPMVALVGASGAGKSSVVRAGLLPRLRQDTEHPWEILTIVPGDRPLHKLAAAFMPLLQPELNENDLLIEIGKQAKAFIVGELSVRDVVERILKKQVGTERLLLVVDQWEELYTLAKSDPEKAPKAAAKQATQINQSKLFIDGLLEACAAKKLLVVLTLRGDFMGKVIAYRPLSDQLKDAQVNLSAMTPSELQAAIEQPAQKLNTGFAPGLVDLLLADIDDEPGNLPLLEFVLKQLWNDPNRTNQLRLEAYKSMGRLQGALQQKADALYNNLPSDQDRQQLRSLFLQLVVSNEANHYTRRRAYQDHLQAYMPLIKQLTAERLLLNNRDEQSNRSTLEVAHEALIRDWPKLATWLKEDQDFLSWRKRLNGALDDFEIRHDQQALLKGQHLQDALSWRKRKARELNAQESRFIQQSNAHAIKSKIAYGLLILTPVALVTSFFLWASINDLSPPSLAVSALLADYFHYVHAPEMVTIPPNQDCTPAKPCEFMMGSKEGGRDNEKPQHAVAFTKPFKLGRYEVTFDEYRIFAHIMKVDKGNCQLTDQKGKSYRHEIPKPNDYNWGFGQHPAIYVSWEDAQCYVQWLNRMAKGKAYRLPSEAEWEYAARAGSISDYYWGDPGQAEQYALFSVNSGDKAHPVGQKQPNAFGLYDMVGNVWEWLQDCYAEDYSQAAADGAAWESKDCSSRVLRGGSWLNLQDNLRSAYRNWREPDNRNFFIGFRLAQDSP